MGATPTHHPPTIATPSTTDSSLRTVPRQRREVSAHAAVLLHQAQLGDREAFADRCHGFHAPITAYVTRRIRDHDPDAVPDLVCDAVCHALARLHTAPADVRGWLIFLAAKACISHHWFLWTRRRHLSAAYAIHGEATRAEQSPTSTDLPARLDRARFAHALARLTPDQRRAGQLRSLDGYPPDAAACLMRRSLGAVRRLRWKTLKRLKASLQPGDVATAKAGTAR